MTAITETTELDPELDALFAELEDPVPTVAKSDDCTGSIVVATIDEILGRGKCDACTTRVECAEVLALVRKDLPAFECFGNPEIHPAVQPKPYCSMCSHLDECRAIRWETHHIEPALRKPPRALSKTSTVTPSYVFPIDEVRTSVLLAKYDAQPTLGMR